MSNRITGLATGLDIDELVKTTMQGYKTKVDSQKQQKDILEIKQQLYRDVIEEGQEFYNKYFDLAKTGNLLTSSSYQSVKFTSSNESVATAVATSSAIKDNYKIDVKSLATSSSTVLTSSQLSSDMEITNSSGKSVIISSSDLVGLSESEQAKYINSKISSLGLKASVSDFSNGITVETISTGSDQSFSIKSSGILEEFKNGTDLKAIISNSTGTVAYGYTAGDPDIPTGAIIAQGSSNTVTLDGVTFTLSDVGSSTVSGKIDATELKDKIVSFVNDYNNLIIKLNTLLNETKYRDYAPLTEDQKSEMSETEIELWNNKVKSGQLRNDSDLSRIVNNLKSAMSSTVSGAGNVLEKIGIKAVNDYSGNKNGTFSIDEDALKTAIENDPESIMNIFIQKGDTKATTGILYRMKDILNDEFVSTTKSPLIKKAGLKGTSSFTQNTLSKQISKYETKIKQMEDALKDREQALYSKWANIETLMNNYNSQMLYLSSMFGTN